MSGVSSVLARCLHRLRQRYWRIFRPVTLGVAAIALDAQDRVLLVRNSYRSGWHLPGGGVRRAETISQAVVRELFEETGVRIPAEPSRIWGVFSNFSDRNYDHVVVFLLPDCNFTALRGPSFEIDEVRAFPRSALPADIGAGSSRRIEEYSKGRIDRLVW